MGVTLAENVSRKFEGFPAVLSWIYRNLNETSMYQTSMVQVKFIKLPQRCILNWAAIRSFTNFNAIETVEMWWRRELFPVSIEIVGAALSFVESFQSSHPEFSMFCKIKLYASNQHFQLGQSTRWMVNPHLDWMNNSPRIHSIHFRILIRTAKTLMFHSFDWPLEAVNAGIATTEKDNWFIYKDLYRQRTNRRQIQRLQITQVDRHFRKWHILIYRTNKIKMSLFEKPLFAGHDSHVWWNIKAQLKN